MQWLILVRALWKGHRPGLIAVGVLLIVNVGMAFGLQHYLVPAVDQREQLLIRRQAELRGGGAGSEPPALIYAQGERDLAEFNKKIPPHREFTGLIKELQGLAEDAGLALTQVSYSRESEKAGLLRYTLGFSLAGKYVEIKQFIHALEQSPRLMLIEQVSLQGGNNDEGSEVRLQLSVATFFRAGKG